MISVAQSKKGETFPHGREKMKDNVMMKFNRKQLRLKEYDYSMAGGYFNTICTKDKELYFENEKIRGIVEECWLNIPEHFDSIELDSYVIMPNHLHGILFLETVVGKRHAYSL